MSSTPLDPHKHLHAVAYEFQTLLGVMCFKDGNFSVDSYIWPEGAVAARRNAVIEIKALHARNLAEFLAFDSHKLYVRAKDYIPEYQAKDAAALQKIVGRASAHLAHLSRNRVADVKPEEKDWGPEFLRPLLVECQHFAEELLKTSWVQGEGAEHRHIFAGAVNLIPMLLDHFQEQAKIQAPAPVATGMSHVTYTGLVKSKGA